MPYPTNAKEIQDFFNDIAIIQIIENVKERNQAIDSVFGELIKNTSVKIEDFYRLFSENPEGKAYQKLLIYCTLRVALERNGIAQEQATKLYTLFNKNIKEIKIYLCNYANKFNSSPEPMHDACNFAIPSQDSQYNAQVWSELSKQHLINPGFRAFLAQAPEIEVLIMTQDRAVPVADKPSKETIVRLEIEISHLTKSIKKSRSQINRLTSEERFKLQKDEADLMCKKSELTTLGIPFNNELTVRTLDIFREKYVIESSSSYKQFLENGLTKKDHEKFTNLVRQDDDTLIPPLRIDGATIGHPGYYLMKVPVMEEAHAARAAYFGKLTNCCQSLSGQVGQPCVIHGLTSPYGGFYVVCHGDVANPKITDEVLGQSWVWRGEKDAFVFDSIERSGNDIGIYENTNKIIIKLIHEAAQQLVERYNIDKVLCGAKSGISEKVGIAKSLNSGQFRDYKGYSDAKSQMILRDKHRPFYLFNIEKESTDATLDWITEQLKGAGVLIKSNLWEALNWALIVSNANLIQTIQSLAVQESSSRSSETNDLISSLNEYIKYGLTHKVHSALENNLFPLEARNTKMQTPLIVAIQSNKINSFFALIENGANLENTDSHGCTALMYAIQYATQYDNTAAIRLIKDDINLEQIDNLGRTVLIWAVQFSRAEIVAALINEKVNLEYIDNDGKTALMHALTLKDPAIALALIKANVSLEPIKNITNTPLIGAIRFQQTEIALAIIEAGANIEYVDNNRKTAMMYALESNNTQIISAIKKRLEANDMAPPSLARAASKNEPETKTEQPELPPDLLIRHRRSSR